MSGNLFHLLKVRRFAPLFVTQFMGAFNDNVFKNALVFLVTYKIAVEQGWTNSAVIVPLAGGLFILPFFLFSSLAGQLSDKFEKSRLIRLIKFVEILLMAVASYGIYSENVTVMMVTLFLMGSQSTFFGPLKYSILPEHLKHDELIGGNALIEMGTFLSIILGLIVGGMLILVEGGPMIISAIVLTVATIGFLSSFAIPKTIPADANLKINFNILQETGRIINDSRQDRKIFLSIPDCYTRLPNLPTPFAKTGMLTDKSSLQILWISFSLLYSRRQPWLCTIAVSFCRTSAMSKFTLLIKKFPDCPE